MKKGAFVGLVGIVGWVGFPQVAWGAMSRPEPFNHESSNGADVDLNEQFEGVHREIEAEIVERLEIVIDQIRTMLNDSASFDRATIEQLQHRLATHLLELAEHQMRKAFEDCPEVWRRCASAYRVTMAEAIATLETLGTDRHYRRADEALFALAMAHKELAIQAFDTEHNTKQSMEVLQQLVQRYPQSAMTPTAWFEIGEYWYEVRESPIKAIAAYKRATTNIDPFMAPLVYYKLGWAYHAMGAEDDGVATLWEAVRLSLHGAQQREERLDLSQEALADLAVWHAELGQVEDALALIGRCCTDQRDSFVSALADRLASMGALDQAIGLWEKRIAEDPLDTKRPEWALQVVDAELRRGGHEAALERLLVLAEEIENGSWRRFHSDNDRAIHEVTLLTQKMLGDIATDAHRMARRGGGRIAMEAAIGAYRAYIERFGDTEEAYDVRFWYAEALYTLGSQALQRADTRAFARQYLEAAADEYEVVRDQNPSGAHLQEAALGAIFALDQLLLLEGKERRLAD